MRKHRPIAVLVLGIIDLGFGALLLLCGLFAGLQLLLLASLLHLAVPEGTNALTDYNEFLVRECPGYQVVELGRAVLELFLGIGLIAAGVGLLSMGNWARRLALACAVFAIPLDVGYATYEIGFTAPATQRWQEEFYRKQGMAMPPNFAAMSEGPAMIQAAFVALLGVMHSTTNLIILLLPGVRAAFAGKVVPPGHGSDEGHRRPPPDDRGE